MSRTRTEDTTGFQSRGDQVRVVVRVNGTLRCHPWVRRDSITNEGLRAWRDRQRADDATGPQAGSFAAHVAAYLARPEVKALALYRARVVHLHRWLEVLGRDRRPTGILTTEIDYWLHVWETTPTKTHQGKPRPPLAPGTILVRRTALKSCLATLPGANPAEDAYVPERAKPTDRSRDYVTLERILDAMSEFRDTTPKRPSLARVRAGVMAYTGLPPSLLKKVKPFDLDWQQRTVRITPRRKGRGVEARTIELSGEGFKWFQAFHAAHAYGPFKTASVNDCVQRAARHVGIDPATFHLYDLRHSFLTQVYRVTGDLATVARLALHSPGSPITERYALGAQDAVDRRALVAFDASVAAQRAAAAVHQPADKLPRKVTGRRKSFVASGYAAQG